MNIAVIPRDLSTEMTVDVPFMTSVNPSESGYSSRNSQRDIPLRIYNITVNPDAALEVMSIILALRGARWPVAIRDWAGNYQLTNEIQTIEADKTINLSRTFTPITGTRTYTQRVLMLDETDQAFSVTVDGSPIAASPAGWTMTDPCILNIPGLTGSEVVRVTGQYLVPAVFIDDALSMTVHVDGVFSIQSMRLQEIGEQELIALTA